MFCSKAGHTLGTGKLLRNLTKYWGGGRFAELYNIQLGRVQMHVKAKR